MKSIVSALLSIVISFSAFAVESSAGRGMSPEPKEKRQEIREKVLANTGGVLVVPGKGKISVVNAQTIVSSQFLEERLRILHRMIRVNMHLTDGTFDIYSTSKDFNQLGANVLIYIVNDKGLPISLVATESRWGLVNVAALSVGEANTMTLNSRVGKAITRVTALLLGGLASRSKTSTMQVFTCAEDFDKVDDTVIPPEVYISVIQNMKMFGITQNKMTTYKKACEEGWAPTPTNAYQKAIWDRFKAEKERGPSNPLQIKP